MNPYKINWDVAGSYRRGEPTSGDIDLLVESLPGLNMLGVVTLLQSIIPAKLVQGESLFMGVVRLDEQHNGHRIDIRLVDSFYYPTSLMYFTGSQQFNILMRQRAIELEMKLNEYGLYLYGDIQIPTMTEQDIFKYLGVAYLSPIERTRTLGALRLI